MKIQFAVIKINKYTQICGVSAALADDQISAKTVYIHSLKENS
jgi:hypothetical protein